MSDDPLPRCVNWVLASLHHEYPGMGAWVAFDATDVRAYASGRRTDRYGNQRPPSDPDASWGHRSAVSTRKGGTFYGFKLHLLVCVTTGLPLAWTIQTAKDAESHFVLNLLSEARDRGFPVEIAIGDKGYDSQALHLGCMAMGIAPVIPIRATDSVKRGAAGPPYCEHGSWTFAGADYARRATKWRCPSGQCSPASRWVKADRLHPLIPRESKRFRDLYWKRTAVEREFANLKERWSLVPLRVRGIDRVRQHADLTILARLACALLRTRRTSFSGPNREPV